MNIKASILQELIDELYCGDNPYLSAQLKYVDQGYPHSGIHPSLIEEVLTLVKPRLWLEVGTMLGGSAIKTAEAVKRLALPTEIVCIDPFCGDVNMWAWERPYREQNKWLFLRLQDCRSTIYERFLANVLSGRHNDIILPIAVTSMVGVALLKRLRNEGRLSALPEVIFLDSAHEPDETLMEIQKCWSLLPTGGVLIGDDWGWDSVRLDALKFIDTIEPKRDVLDGLAERIPNAQLFEGKVVLHQMQWIIAK